ncbi:hypothetical protein HYY74_06620 [Candidatus Woesearchaeota archaeon]|nr:hypothetical protein [Candidatus Woesearchaeota archaeon]
MAELAAVSRLAAITPVLGRPDLDFIASGPAIGRIYDILRQVCEHGYDYYMAAENRYIYDADLQALGDYRANLVSFANWFGDNGGAADALALLRAVLDKALASLRFYPRLQNRIFADRHTNLHELFDRILLRFSHDLASDISAGISKPRPYTRDQRLRYIAAVVGKRYGFVKDDDRFNLSKRVGQFNQNSTGSLTGG